MADIADWDPVDDANTDAPPNGWPEFMQPSAVNNSARAMMGAIRRWYDTVTASLASINTAVGNKVNRSGDTMTGDLTISEANTAEIFLNRTSGSGGSQLVGQFQGTTRWLLQLGVSPSDDFALHRYASSGGYLGASITIERESGLMSLNGTVRLAQSPTYGDHATRKDYVDQRDQDVMNWSWSNITNWAAGQDSTTYNNATAYAASLHNAQQASIDAKVAKGGDTMSGDLTVASVLYAHDVMPSVDNVSICGGAASAWNVVEAYNFVTKSDAALKTDIGPLPDMLSLVAAVTPQSFRYKGSDDRRHWGFVAQDVRAATGDYPVDLVAGDEGRLGLDYSGMTAALWKAVQELNERLKALEAR